MKKILLVWLLQLPISICYGQATEVSVQASSGFAFYGGKSASSTTAVLINDTPKPLYWVYLPYGKQSGFSYGFSIQAQRVSNGNLVFGIKGGYDKLSTVSHFDSYQTMGGSRNVMNGTVKLQNNLVQVNPYFGYRLPGKSTHLDMTAGINASWIMKSAYTISYDDQSDFFDRKEHNPYIYTKIDLGLTVGLAVGYKRIGVSASYFHGLVNYLRMRDSASNVQIYSRYLRFGVFYRIK